MKKIIIIIPALLLAGSAMAGERLNDSELEALLSDKTLTGEHFKRGSVKTYYSADGKVTSKSDGASREGKWWVEDGKRCIRWTHKNKDFCHYIERNGDGTYTLVHSKKGKKLVEIESSVEGNQL